MQSRGGGVKLRHILPQYLYRSSEIDSDIIWVV